MEAIDFVLNIIPKTIVGSFADGEILQVLFFSVLFGIAMASIGEANQRVILALEQISKALMRMIAMIIRLAPLAVFGAMSYTVSNWGLQGLKRRFDAARDFKGVAPRKLLHHQQQSRVTINDRIADQGLIVLLDIGNLAQCEPGSAVILERYPGKIRRREYWQNVTDA